MTVAEARSRVDLPAGSPVTRCGWCLKDPLYIKYHDKEWGVLIKNDQKLFEFLVLESAQAGLSWLTILRKRENYRLLYSGFDVEKVARYGSRQVTKLLGDAGIIRNRAKIEASINNAKKFIDIQSEFGSFYKYSLQFIDGEVRHNRWASLKEIPATTKESDAFAKELKSRGFKFLGSTVLYAHMQATGMVNDHITSCFRYQNLVSKTR